MVGDRLSIDPQGVVVMNDTVLGLYVYRVSVNRIDDSTNPRLKARLVINLNRAFILKCRLLQREDGQFFLAMPEESVFECCPECHYLNRIDASYCNNCAHWLIPKTLTDRTVRMESAHPVVSEVRVMLTNAGRAAYQASLQPDVCHYRWFTHYSG